ncbi:HAMP domain-containing histidine kinase [Paenibacillus antri]|uniref:Circadian input-output histidine kinase CikA n=1 Tax=Paenibacillus antri TaxID=2582848 RepID=A0A5R9G7C1_9BACL|nr:HAMP domain-containing sensor histidine kinase [Paenibacillus antri]TLS49990.1 HAMP domain-containing histidine kinase [Paenibacillus antri]
MNINRIGFKLGATIIALFVIVLFALGFVIDRVFSNFYHAEMREEVEELAVHFASMANTDEGDMIQTFAEFSNVSIYLTDGTEQETVSLGKTEVSDLSFIRSSDLKRLAAGQSVFIEFESAQNERFFIAAEPVGVEGKAIYVLSSMHNMEQSLNQVRSLLALSGAGALFLALGFTYIVSQLLSRPMLEMEQAARRIAKGELETRLAVRSSDEVGTLAEAINDLAKDLQHYRDTRQEFFANVSHELRTPITYLEGYAKVLSDELYETEEEKQKYLAIIRQESFRLNRLIHDLFELAKMEEGQLNLTLERVDLKEIVESAVEKVRLRAREKGLSILSSLEDDIPPIIADGLRMEQVLLNLLENAVRYTEEGSIQVRLRNGESGCQLTVEDTGVGIPTDELPYIFERFYRVEKSRSRQYGGTGLGLAITRKLVELQGGTIEVFSQVAAGTRVVITFPANRSKGWQTP